MEGLNEIVAGIMYLGNSFRYSEALVSYGTKSDRSNRNLCGYIFYHCHVFQELISLPAFLLCLDIYNTITKVKTSYFLSISILASNFTTVISLSPFLLASLLSIPSFLPFDIFSKGN